MQGCPTFLLVLATFTGEKLLRATCIFTKIKLQIIASLLYKIGAHFGQYFGYLFHIGVARGGPGGPGPPN